MTSATNTPLRVGIYARVSTVERGQDPENQLRQLREYAARLGWAVSQEYVDHVSGKSGDRPAFKRLLQDAAQRRFDVLLVWALDRLTRQGVLETFQYIRDLGRWGAVRVLYRTALPDHRTGRRTYAGRCGLDRPTRTPAPGGPNQSGAAEGTSRRQATGAPQGRL